MQYPLQMNLVHVRMMSNISNTGSINGSYENTGLIKRVNYDLSGYISTATIEYNPPYPDSGNI